MDSFTDPEVRECWFMKSAQVGWTSALENVIGFFVDQDPSPILLVQPTLHVAEGFSKTRLAPMLRDTPRLHGKLADVKSRSAENTLLLKKFNGGHLVMAGANAPAGLASNPIRIALFDEIDRYPLSAGTEGDPLSLGIKRTAAWWNRKIGGGSTPVLKGSSLIEDKYSKSDQRHWFVPCPHCGELQTLKWAQVKFENHEPETARYLCEHCGTLWTDVERWAAIAHGRWTPSKPFTGIRGYHLNAIASQFVRLPDMVREFLEAKGNPEKLKTFTNTSLAETWEETGATIEPGSLLEHRGTYSEQRIPLEALLVTAGVDVQDDRIEVQANAWGADEENWILEQKVFRGDPDSAELWGEVDEHLRRRYVTEDGRELTIEAAAIDSGGHHTQRVYQFVVSRKRRRVWAVKGMAGPGRLAWPKKASRAAKSRANVFIVGVDTIKGVLYGRLGKIAEPGPGYIHLFADADEDFCRQLTSEKAVTKYVRGRAQLVWSPRSEGIKQEGQDCWIYAYAAFVGRGGPDLLKRLAKRPAVRAITQQIAEPAPIEVEVTPAAQPTVPVPRPVAPAPRHPGRFSRKGQFRR